VDGFGFDVIRPFRVADDVVGGAPVWPLTIGILAPLPLVRPFSPLFCHVAFPFGLCMGQLIMGDQIQ